MDRDGSCFSSFRPPACGERQIMGYMPCLRVPSFDACWRHWLNQRDHREMFPRKSIHIHLKRPVDMGREELCFLVGKFERRLQESFSRILKPWFVFVLPVPGPKARMRMPSEVSPLLMLRMAVPRSRQSIRVIARVGACRERGPRSVAGHGLPPTSGPVLPAVARASVETRRKGLPSRGSLATFPEGPRPTCGQGRAQTSTRRPRRA